MSTLRFSDVGPLSKLMLKPIEGYENKPLVSIEQAIEPLINIVPKVKRNVAVVKRNCRQPEDGLSTDESAAIMLYTYESNPREHSLYYILNQTLRSEQRKKLIPWFLFLKLITTALLRLPTQRRMAFRGVRKDLRKEYPVGNRPVIWWAFSSCSSKIDVLENDVFFGQTGTRTLFQIDTFSGRDIRNHSFVPTESEILLLPAREFLVRSTFNCGNELYMIQLEEIQSDSSQSESSLMSSSIVALPRSDYQSIKCIAQVSSIMRNLPGNARWNPLGVTVLHGLNGPLGLAINEDDDTVYVADQCSHRIVATALENTEGKVVAGGNGKGSALNQLKYPSDVLIDRETRSLIISDAGNRRIMRWSLEHGTKEGEIIIDNIGCNRLAMDSEGALYVTLPYDHKVRRYKRRDKTGVVVAGGNKMGNRVDQLNKPYYVAVDTEGAVYVSDNGNHRIVRWLKRAKAGEVVAGDRGDGHDIKQLSYPNGVFVDSNKTIYVTEGGNDRVTRWRNGATSADIIVGGNGRGDQANQFRVPVGLSFDSRGNLYIVDNGNHRVQRFSIL